MWHLKITYLFSFVDSMHSLKVCQQTVNYRGEMNIIPVFALKWNTPYDSLNQHYSHSQGAFKLVPWSLHSSRSKVSRGCMYGEWG